MTRPRRALLPLSSLLLLALCACRRGGSESERGRAASTARDAAAPPAMASSSALLPSPSTSATAAPTTPKTSAEQASAALDESTMDRLVFREILAGGQTSNWRRTWILYRTEKRARLDVLCQSGLEHMQLSGRENDEGAWRAPVLMRYVGVREGTGAYHVNLTSGTRGEWECDWMPESFVLSCQAEPIFVLQARAELIMAFDERESQWSSRWAPPTEQRVTGLRCESEPNGHLRFPWTRVLVFVTPRNGAPGIEWAFLHHGHQRGGYRWMSAPK